MATGSAFSQFQLLLREEIDNSVYDLTLPEDDVAWGLFQTFQPVDIAGRMTNRAGLSSEGSAGYEASWRVMTQRSGRVSGGVFTGNTLVMSGPGDKQVMGQAADARYLDPAKTPDRSYLDIKMLLKRVLGQLTVNQQQILADLGTRPLTEVANEKLADAVYQVHSLFTSLVYSQGNGVLAQVNNGAGYSILEASPVYVAVDAGTVFRFIEGQRYVAASLSSGVPTTPRAGSMNSPGVFRCVEIDIDNLVVAFQSETGEGTIALSDNDGIIVEGLYDFGAAASRAMQSFETLLINSGTYPGTNYAVTTYRKLMSFISGSESSPIEPEPEVLAKIMDKMENAGKPRPPLVIGEPSLWSRYAFLEKQNQMLMTVPQGGPFRTSGGVEGPMLSHMGQNFQRLTSPKIRPGSWLGFDPKTFKRFMPLTNTIRWLMLQGGVTGMSGIFRLVTQGTQATELMAADFDFFVEMGQTDPRTAFRQIGLYTLNTAS